jgi:hypothetical protein
MTNGLPTTAVYDLTIHPRDRDVIIGTHGNGIYILDDITALEAWRPALAAKPVHLFTQRTATLWADMSRKGQLGENTYAGENPPSVAPVAYGQRDRARLVNTPLITFYLGDAATGTASLEVTSPDGVSRTLSIPAKPGITRYAWDMRSQAAVAAGASAEPSDETGAGAAAGRGGRGVGGGRGAGAGGGGRGGGGGAAGGRGNAEVGRVMPGVYALKLTIAGATATGDLVVREDPLLSRR